MENIFAHVKIIMIEYLRKGNNEVKIIWRNELYIDSNMDPVIELLNTSGKCRIYTRNKEKEWKIMHVENFKPRKTVMQLYLH